MLQVLAFWSSGDLDWFQGGVCGNSNPGSCQGRSPVVANFALIETTLLAALESAADADADAEAAATAEAAEDREGGATAEDEAAASLMAAMQHAAGDDDDDDDDQDRDDEPIEEEIDETNLMLHPRPPPPPLPPPPMLNEVFGVLHQTMPDDPPPPPPPSPSPPAPLPPSPHPSPPEVTTTSVVLDTMSSPVVGIGAAVLLVFLVMSGSLSGSSGSGSGPSAIRVPTPLTAADDAEDDAAWGGVVPAESKGRRMPSAKAIAGAFGEKRGWRGDLRLPKVLKPPAGGARKSKEAVAGFKGERPALTREQARARGGAGLEEQGSDGESTVMLVADNDHRQHPDNGAYGDVWL